MLKQALKLYERLQDIEDERLLAKAWQDCKKEQINQEGQRFDFFFVFFRDKRNYKGRHRSPWRGGLQAFMARMEEKHMESMGNPLIYNIRQVK